MKAAERERTKQKRSRIDDDVDQLMDNGVCINPLLRACYGPASAVRARMHLVCSVCSYVFNEVIFQ